ncbi:MAG: peptidoglycan editing factor PgeF [Anaerolineae bacterium]|nr:MAG: peptidoglycan editing factor PgeF [Anaerolineae bacterium]
MPFHQPDTVRYYTFESFADLPVTQMAFTRAGGVSPGDWASLNMGLTVGDAEANVAENRRIAFRTAGRPLESLSDSWLVHGADVLVYDHPRSPEEESPRKADIILTDNSDVTLFMRYADCVPILLVDPVCRAIGLAHAGWQGTLKGVAAKAVSAMQSRYGSRPADIHAAIGPSISAERYEVGPEVAAQVQAAFGVDAAALLPAFGDRIHFDLWAANRLMLEQAGVGQVEVCGLCTASHPEDWFSHRGQQGKAGRFGVLLALNGG